MHYTEAGGCTADRLRIPVSQTSVQSVIGTARPDLAILQNAAKTALSRHSKPFSARDTER
jgi:hypothetical protein